MPTILCVGEDSGLLDSRAALLRLTGAEVICCSAQVGPVLIRTRHFDLVVLCHTLQYDPITQISDYCEREKISILLIEPLTGYRLAGGKISSGVMVNAQPASLIHTTANLLNQVDQPSLLNL
jgi:hypothetical protein